MTYVRQQDKRLCVQLRGPFECFFGFAAAKYQNQTVLKQGTISRLTYKIKIESLITESCPSPPRPVFRIFGRFVPEHAAELNT